jgi:hypothetical protein
MNSVGFDGSFVFDFFNAQWINDHSVGKKSQVQDVALLTSLQIPDSTCGSLEVCSL